MSVQQDLYICSPYVFIIVLSLEVIDTAKELFAITCERFIDVDFIVACSSETHCGLYGRQVVNILSS